MPNTIHPPHREGQTGSNILESEASTASFDFVVTKPAWVISDHHLSDTELCQWFRATYPDHTDVCSPDLQPPESFLLTIPSFPAWLHGGAVSLMGCLAWLSTTPWHKELLQQHKQRNHSNCCCEQAKESCQTAIPARQRCGWTKIGTVDH